MTRVSLIQFPHDFAQQTSCHFNLGAPRSGTSWLARLLNALGAKLPEQLVEPAHTNVFGFWEPTKLMEIDDEILSAIDRTWYDPRPIPRAWFRSKAAYAFQKRIASVIASDYGDAPLILIKEPRICRLAPLYLNVLDVLASRAARDSSAPPSRPRCS